MNCLEWPTDRAVWLEERQCMHQEQLRRIGVCSLSSCQSTIAHKSNAHADLQCRAQLQLSSDLTDVCFGRPRLIVTVALRWPFYTHVTGVCVLVVYQRCVCIFQLLQDALENQKKVMLLVENEKQLKAQVNCIVVVRLVLDAESK
jgi:hypothetical protein